ncbi:MAG: Bacterial extracellular solute-binding family protein [Bacilli bacterium]|nr:Bacterial extracellular solute-binding family protein [Bacilli bacterium]
MKKTLFIVITVFMLVALVGCNSGSSSSNSPSSSAGTDSKDPVQLTFWSFLNPDQTGDPRSEALKSIVESFNASHDKIKVKAEGINFAKIDSQVIQAVASGGGPDILNVYTELLQMHIGAKTIQPITKYAKDWLAKGGKDYIYSEDQLKINNEIYAIPWEARVMTMYYRKDLYEKAGLSVPATLPELIESSKKVGDNNRLGYAVGFSEGAYAASFMESFVPVLIAAGGELFDKNGKATFNSDAGVKATQFYKDMIAKGGMTNQTISMTADDIANAQKAGNIATAFAGSHRASAIRGSDVGKNIASAPIPPFEKGQPSPVVAAGQTLTMGVNTKYPDQVWEFIQYFLSKESEIKWAKASVVPVLSSVFDEPSVKKLANYADLVQWKDSASKFGKIQYYPADYTKLSVELAKGVQKIVFQNASAKETLDSVANTYNSNKK